MTLLLSGEAQQCKHSLFKCMKKSKMLILGIIPLGHVSGLWLKMVVETLLRKENVFEMNVIVAFLNVFL